jgi:cell division protein FtsN
MYRSFPGERRVNSHIYKVDEGYILQASSWPAKSKAEREAQRLRDFGYDAFITKAYIEKYGATWYRIRIGYFDSIQQAENFENKNKKKLEGKL